MKKKKKLKKVVKISMIALFIGMLSGMLYLSKVGVNKHVLKENDEYVYVDDNIFDSYYPVVLNNEEKIIRPYNAENISLYRNFYEMKDAKEKQEKSIVLSDGTYIQNTGVDYKSDNPFDVVASYSGVVTNITDDTILGKTIEIKSDNNFVITYQSLSNVLVKKGDNVNQGDVIGKSGSCSINNNEKNTVHIEMCLNGHIINPETSYEKNINELIDKE